MVIFQRTFQRKLSPRVRRTARKNDDDDEDGGGGGEYTELVCMYIFFYAGLHLIIIFHIT